jgi:hypothetical protein
MRVQPHLCTSARSWACQRARQSRGPLYQPGARGTCGRLLVQGPSDERQRTHLPSQLNKSKPEQRSSPSEYGVLRLGFTRLPTNAVWATWILSAASYFRWKGSPLCVRVEPKGLRSCGVAVTAAGACLRLTFLRRRRPCARGVHGSSCGGGGGGSLPPPAVCVLPDKYSVSSEAGRNPQVMGANSSEARAAGQMMWAKGG